MRQKVLMLLVLAVSLKVFLHQIGGERRKERKKKLNKTFMFQGIYAEESEGVLHKKKREREGEKTTIAGLLVVDITLFFAHKFQRTQTSCQLLETRADDENIHCSSIDL